MRRGARWHSIEMAGVVTQTGANIIKDARVLVEEIGRPLELDTDGIWCMPELDTRVLTSRGFLFLDEIERCIAEAAAGASEPLLYASYDSKTRSLQYLPAELVIRDGAPPSQLVDFTQAATRAIWDVEADAPISDVTEKANHVSIRVTPLHDMYAQLGDRTMETGHMQSKGSFGKIKAELLTPGRAQQSTIEFMHAAELGASTAGLLLTDTDASSPVCALSLSSEDAIDAFLELYGYWLEDGSIKYATSTDGVDAVLFLAVKDVAYLRALFARLRLVEGRDFRANRPYALADGRTVTNLLVVNRWWFEYFDSEYWIQYKIGRERHGGSEMERMEALRRRGISPSNAHSAKWFWGWVLQRLNARQMRLLLDGLRCADGDRDITASRKDSAEAEVDEPATAIHTSSVCFRDFLMNACLHAGFTACSNFQATAAARVVWQRAPHDGHSYSDAEMLEVRAEEPDASFVQVQQNAAHWRVDFSSRATRLLDVADVQYDGAAATASSPGYSVARDGRLWCVRLPSSSDQLIVAQRAHRDLDGSVGRVSRPIVLGNCMIPSTFPETFQVALRPGLTTSEGKPLTSLEISYPCSMLNIGVHDNYTNDRYQTKQPDGSYVISKENGIFFEVDGPYGAMILPASRDEGKNIKKRYAVFSEKGQLKELKGFEIKRRGELQLIKIFQEQVFAKFLDGKTLTECYASVGAAANHWLDVCENGGRDLQDDDVFALISENKNMSEALEDYGERKSTSIQTARRLGEFLGDEMVKDKGLNCKFIITKKPLGAPTSERAVPVAIFSAEDAVKKTYLRRWLKDASLANFDVRDLLDWDYYIGRLKNAIQKIITIPAAFQKVPNPVPRVEHPDWLRKKIKERDETHKQTRVSSYFTSSAAGAAGDMEDIGGSQARGGNQFTDPLRPKFATVKRRVPAAAVAPVAAIMEDEEESKEEQQAQPDEVPDGGKRRKVRVSKEHGASVGGTGLLADDGASSDSGSTGSPSGAGRRRRGVVTLDGETLEANDEEEDGTEGPGVAPLEADTPSSLADKALDLTGLSPAQLSPSKARRDRAASSAASAAGSKAKASIAGRFDAPSSELIVQPVEPSETDDFAGWIRYHSAKWQKLRAQRKAERAAESRLAAAALGSGSENVKLGRDGLTGFLKKSALQVRASYWQVVQIVEESPGVFRLWVLLDSGALAHRTVTVPRVVYVNSRLAMPELEASSSATKVVRTLPRGRPCLNLYEYSMSEREWVENEKSFHTTLSSRSEIEGMYETQVPLQFKIIMEIGCVCKLDPRSAPVKESEYTLNQLLYKTTAECPYLDSPSQPLRRLYLFHSFADSRGVFGLFNMEKQEVVVVAVNPYRGELEKFSYKNMLRGCVQAARDANAMAVPATVHHDGTEAQPASSQSRVPLPSPEATFKTHTVKDFDAGFALLDRLLRAYKDSTSAPTILVVQAGGHSVQSLYATMPSIRDAFPVVSVQANLGDNLYPALNWYSVAVKRMTERFVAHPAWWAEQLHFCRYAHVPIGNIESDYPAFISDLFFARALKHSGHLLWMSNGPRPDLGGLEEDENYFADEHINPETSKPGVYRKVCMEIDIGQLAVNAVVQQQLIEESEGGIGLGLAATSSSSTATVDGVDTQLALRSLQEGSGACRDAFRILKNCVSNWLSDTLHNQNEDADMLLRHFYRWLCSPSSKLYDGALHRFVHALMKKILAQLLGRFRKLGSTIVFANQSKMILATNKSSVAHALSYTKYILDTVQSRPLFQMLTLDPSRMWESLAFLDAANFGGILAEGQDDDDVDELGNPIESVGRGAAGDDKITMTLRSGRTLKLSVHSHWNLADYLPRETQPLFLVVIAKFLLEPHKLRLEAAEEAAARIEARKASSSDFSATQHLATLGSTSLEQDEEQLAKQVAHYISADFSRELFEQVAHIKQMLRGSEMNGEESAIQFPVLAGSHLPLHHPALEFAKSVCHVLSLDAELTSTVRVLRESLMKLVGVKSFSPEAAFSNPCMTFVLSDVICSYCNQCRDLDLCRDPELTFHSWRCTVCAQPYDLGVIEWMLVEFVYRRACAYQVQDLSCGTCGKIKQTNMAKYCPCSGHFVNTNSPQAIDRVYVKHTHAATAWAEITLLRTDSRCCLCACLSVQSSHLLQHRCLPQI